MFRIVLKATKMAQNIVREVVGETDTAVDATLGNGNDTLFLSNLLPMGKVFSFDIQMSAIEKFKQNNENCSNVMLIHDGHENIDKYPVGIPKVIMFNLGYLPGGDEKIITKAESTTAAVGKGLKLLCPGGIMTIIIYSGHEGGAEERDSVLELVRNLNARDFSVMETQFSNGKKLAPLLVVIEKNNSHHADR
jgi:hypothetical protein